jgi:ElaB/YqjD/DUF883 family membrane-anchored ribosome-binding protein
MPDGKSNDDASIAALRDDLDRLREDVATLTHHLGSAGESAYDDVRRRAREASRSAGDAARERYQQGRSGLESEIAERPLTIIGVAFAAGLLLGRGLGR